MTVPTPGERAERHLRLGRRRRDAALSELILRDEGLAHPMVLGELACGTPPAPRERTLGDVGLLRRVKVATWSEVGEFIEAERLYGLGCGLVDVALLASTLMTPGASLWTLDRRLELLASRFGVAYAP